MRKGIRAVAGFIHIGVSAALIFVAIFHLYASFIPTKEDKNLDKKLEKAAMEYLLSATDQGLDDEEPSKEK